MLELGEEIAQIGREVLLVARRLDQRAEAIMVLGERLDVRAAELLELGDAMRDLGDRIDMRGGEIADRAGQVVETGAELIAVLPAFERALEMATPLEGAIDRFGRLVDRLPGGATRRRGGAAAPGGPRVPMSPATAVGGGPSAWSVARGPGRRPSPDRPARARSPMRMRPDPRGFEPVHPSRSTNRLATSGTLVAGFLADDRSTERSPSTATRSPRSVAGSDQPTRVLEIVGAAHRQRHPRPGRR